MLIEFSVSNFRSIRELETLSLVAAPIVSKDKTLDDNNMFTTANGTKLLKTTAIYGANGSGKSNLVRALIMMMFFIEKSFSDDDFGKKLSNPFEFDSTSKNKPIFFQITFLCGSEQYRFGFEIKNGKVVSEWLFGRAKKKETYYYKRINDIIKVNKLSFPEGLGLEKGKTKNTTLFLNIVSGFNGAISTKIKTALRKELIIGSGISDQSFKNGTIAMIEKNHDLIVSFLRNADFGITGLKKIPIEKKDLRENVSDNLQRVIGKIDENKHFMLLSERETVSKNGKTKKITRPFDVFESEGTKRFFSYIGPFIDALTAGKTIVIDEFDSRLHPILTKKIVQMFNSKDLNKKNAQLIFITHDTNLLDASFLRRDQVYFVEKNKSGVSHYYSLVNIGGVRNDASYEKDYIKGKYGAIPFLGEFKM